jgi:hypothetical protein
MSTKQELQLTMKTFGYELNPFTSKETLINLLRLHSKVRDLKRKHFGRKISLFRHLKKDLMFQK